MENLIYKAINNVMSEIGAVGKNKKNQSQGFMFRGIDDVMNAINPALTKNNVFIVPEILESSREERTTQKGGLLIYSICKVKYTFYAEDGSSVQAIVIGEGMDSGDKATNKAMAIAFKYACFQVFCIPTEEMKDPDADIHELEPKKKDDKKKPEPKKKEEPKVNPDPLTAEDIRSITDLANEFADVSKMEVSKVFDILKDRYKYQEISSVTKKHGKLMIEQLEAWIKKSKEKAGA